MNVKIGVALLTLLSTILVADAIAQDPTGVSSDIERTATTSPQEKITYAENSNQEIREAEKEIAKLLEQSRKDGDAEAIECLVNRLTSVRALLQVSEAAEVAMKDALANGDDERANHEFRKIAVAISKTRMLLAEAQRCSSDQSLQSGATITEWEVEGVDPVNPDPPDFSTTGIGLTPPPVSPFQ
jgi:hypothetical protein